MVESCRVHVLNSRRAFQRLHKAGKRARSKDLSLVYRIDDSQGTVNVAYSIGKRVGTAVVRNKVKRRLRSLVEEYSCQMPCGDYLVIVSPRAVERDFEELRSELREVLPLKGKQ